MNLFFQIFKVCKKNNFLLFSFFNLGKNIQIVAFLAFGTDFWFSKHLLFMPQLVQECAHQKPSSAKPFQSSQSMLSLAYSMKSIHFLFIFRILQGFEVQFQQAPELIKKVDPVSFPFCKRKGQETFKKALKNIGFPLKRTGIP